MAQANGHPNAHKSPTGPSVDDITKRLVELVRPEKKTEAQALIGKLQKALQTYHELDALSLTNLRKVVAEEVKAAITASKTPEPKTWAAVASQGLPQSLATQPKKVVPARLQREILVRAVGHTANQTKRTPHEVVQAVNQASAKKGAIAARVLPSGDTIVTFETVAQKEWHSANSGWIQQAFGQQAKEAHRSFAILLKGLLRKDLQGLTEDEFQKELGLQSVDKVKFRLPKDLERKRATVLVALRNQEEARRACDNGVVWRSQVWDCEPYWAALDPVQCFKCWKWGHIQRYCPQKEALCPRCGTKAHGEGGKAGEALCPTYNGHPTRCPTCGGPHTAWSRTCPQGAKVREEAKEAYPHRPRTFEATAKLAGPTFTFVASQATQVAQEDDGFQEVARKRKRGRPTYIEVAGRDPLQARLAAIPSSLPSSIPTSQCSQPSQPDQATQATQAVQATSIPSDKQW